MESHKVYIHNLFPPPLFRGEGWGGVLLRGNPTPSQPPPLKRWRGSAGFTLVEALIVVGMFSVLAGASLFIDMNSYRADAFRAKQGALIVELQAARARAQNNINQSPQYVPLEVDGVDILPESLSEIVFEQLSGDASYEGDITLVDQNSRMTGVISINHEGQINW